MFTCCALQGSVMFLFETASGRVLHTGDFRCCLDLLLTIPPYASVSLAHSAPYILNYKACNRLSCQRPPCKVWCHHRLGDQERRAMTQHPAMLSAPINLLYLDNTYCNPRYVQCSTCFAQTPQPPAKSICFAQTPQPPPIN